jgi:hypothetical protein
LVEKDWKVKGSGGKVQVGLVDRPGSVVWIELPTSTLPGVTETWTKHEHLIT